MEKDVLMQMLVPGVVSGVVSGVFSAVLLLKSAALKRRNRRFGVGLDQSVQLLHRAREAVIRQHVAHVHRVELAFYRQLCEVTEVAEAYLTEEARRKAEWSAYAAELRGLALAIGDRELLRLVNKGYSWAGSTYPRDGCFYTIAEMDIRSRSQRLHTRIAQLLEEQ